MSNYGVSEVGTRAGERIDRRMNGGDLTSGLLQCQESVRVAGLWGRRLVSTISWVRLGVCGK